MCNQSLTGKYGWQSDDFGRDVSRMRSRGTSTCELETTCGACGTVGMNPTARWARDRSPDLQARHADDRQERRDDPEPDDDLHFVLAAEQEMIVQWAARQKSRAGPAEPGDLSDHRQRFQNEDPANDNQNCFLPGDERRQSHKASERER